MPRRAFGAGRTLRGEIVRKLIDAVGMLDDDELHYLGLYLESQNHKDVAGDLEITHGAARKRWERILRKLRGFLGDMGINGLPDDDEG